MRLQGSVSPVGIRRGMGCESFHSGVLQKMAGAVDFRALKCYILNCINQTETERKAYL